MDNRKFGGVPRCTPRFNQGGAKGGAFYEDPSLGGRRLLLLETAIHLFFSLCLCHLSHVSLVPRLFSRNSPESIQDNCRVQHSVLAASSWTQELTVVMCYGRNLDCSCVKSFYFPILFTHRLHLAWYLSTVSSLSDSIASNMIELNGRMKNREDRTG